MNENLFYKPLIVCWKLAIYFYVRKPYIVENVKWKIKHEPKVSSFLITVNRKVFDK